MTDKRLRGAVPPIGTPLTTGDRVDEAGLRRLTQYLLQAGVAGILANGTMGGFAFLTDEEQLRALKDEGMSVRKIAAAMNVGTATVQRHLAVTT